MIRCRTMAFATAGLAAFLGGCRIAKSPDGVCFSPLFKISLTHPGENHIANGGWHQSSVGCTVLGTPIQTSGCSIGCGTGCSVGCSTGCSVGCAMGCARGPLVETMPIGAYQPINETITGSPVHYSGPGTQGYLAPVNSAPAMPSGGVPPIAAPNAPAGPEIITPGNQATPPIVKGTPDPEKETGTKAAKPVLPARVQTLIGIKDGKDEVAEGTTSLFGVECRNTGGAPATGLSVRIKCRGATPVAFLRQDIAADNSKKRIDGTNGRIEGDTVVFDTIEALAGGLGVEFQLTFNATATIDGAGRFDVEVRHSALPDDQPENKVKTFVVKK